MAPARIQGVEEKWPAEAWSLVVEFDPGKAAVVDMEVSVSFLAPEAAPEGLLQPGSWFELYEGSRRVAIGVIAGVQ